MTMRLFLLLAFSLLASCATPEARLRAGLQNAGLSPAMSECMAGRMVDRLSLIQLRRMSDLPAARESQSIDQFLHNVRALRETEILTVTSAAAARCAVGLG